VLRAQLRDRTFAYPWHMLCPMANMDIRAKSVKQHLECRFAAKVQGIIARGFIGSKMILRTFAARRSTYFDA
jgi:hypothetical protein